MYPAYDYILLILLYFSTYHPFIHVVALVCVFDDGMVVVEPLGPHVVGVVQLPNGRLCSNCPQLLLVVQQDEVADQVVVPPVPELGLL